MNGARSGTATEPGAEASSIDDIIDDTPRLRRGGTFINRPADVRSASRSRVAPSDRDGNGGFRLARTYY